MKNLIRRFYLLCIVFFFGSSALSHVLFDKGSLDSMIEDYTSFEKELIQDDLKNISQLIFRDRNPIKDGQPIYLATAGAPGAHKSTILETVLNEDPRYTNMAYIDPDVRVLRSMIHTYWAQSLNFYKIRSEQKFPLTQKHAYEHWRAASNYIANTLLEKAINGTFSIAHGTTLTGEKVPRLLRKLKENNYAIRILLCHAPDEVRAQAVEHRETVMAFYQSSTDDWVQKRKQFLKKIPIYFDFADEIVIYWTDRPFHSTKVAVIQSGQLEVLDKVAYGEFVNYLNGEQNSPAYWDNLLLEKRIQFVRNA